MSESILYKRMYTELFNDVTDVIAELDTALDEFKDFDVEFKKDILELQVKASAKSLREAQQKTEQIYIEG